MTTPTSSATPPGSSASTAPAVSSSLEQLLRDLAHTGALGFEGLVTKLLEAATGQRFRIAGSGFQAGMDAGTEPGSHFANRIKVETKHYFASSLSLRELVAEITQSTKAGAFDLWALGATCAISAQHATALEEQAADAGIECLFIDRPTEGLARLDVLMAAHHEVVLRFVDTSGSTVNKALLATELSAIREDPEFAASLSQLQNKLNGTALGYDDARRRARRRLLETLADPGDAEAAFNQRIAILAPDSGRVARKATDESLTGWWTEHAVRGHGAVALGQEGFGKSWAAFAWLAERINSDAFPLTLVFNASAISILTGTTVETLLPELLTQWCGGAPRTWKERLARWLGGDSPRVPLLFILADGLNERADIDWVAFFRPLLTTNMRNRVIVLATDRPGHWQSRSARLENDGFQQIAIGGYSDRELIEVLSGRHIDLSNIPAGLHELIRTPRYCALVADHFDEMKRSGDFSREKLLLLDAHHRRVARRGFPMTEDEFLDVIRSLAGRSRTQAELRTDDLRAVLPDMDARRQVHQEIMHGGLLVKVEGAAGTRYVVEPTRLVFGLGMLLADEAAEAANSQAASELADFIASWLEPHSDMDLKVEACGAAVFHALLFPNYPTIARRELIKHWLGARNRSGSHDEARLAFVLRAPDDFISAVDTFWRSNSSHGAAQAYLAKAFCQYRDAPELQSSLAAAVERWMGYVHAAGPPLLRRPDSEDARRQKIAERVGREPALGPMPVAGRQLTFIEDDGLLRLSRFGLLLMSCGELRPFGPGLITWAVGAAAMGAAMEEDVAAWVVRLSEVDASDHIFSEARRLLERHEPVAAEAGHILLRLLGSKKATDLTSQFPREVPPEVAQRRSEHQTNPCRSFFAWCDSECEFCIDQPDTPLHLILTRAKDKLLDPDRVVSQQLADRFLLQLRGIDPAAVHAEFTGNDALRFFDDLEPIVAAVKPVELADYVRAIVRTMPGRGLEGRRQLALWLPQIYPLLGELEVAAVKTTLAQLRLTAGNWPGINTEDASQTAEAFASWGLMPKLQADARFDEVLSRPPQSLDFDDMDLWFDKPSDAKADETFKAIYSAEDSNLLPRVIWLSAASKLSLSTNDIDYLVQLANGPGSRVRALVARFAVLSSNMDLGRRIVGLQRRYVDLRDAWEMQWGANILEKYGSHVDFQSILGRVNASTAGFILDSRGAMPDEAQLYANVLDMHWRWAVASPTAFDAADLPTVQASPSTSRTETAPLPLFEEDGTSHVFNDASNSWTDGSNMAVSDLQALLAPPDVQSQLSKHATEQEALISAQADPALCLYGQRFSSSALKAVFFYAPDIVEHWVDEALVPGPTARRIRTVLGSFYYYLCDALLQVDVARGLRLWKVLHGEKGSIEFDSIKLLFKAPRSILVDETRSATLDCCHCDEALGRFAIAAQAASDGWLEENIERLIIDSLLSKKATGLALAALSRRTIVEFENLVGRASVSSTWVEAALSTLRRYNRHDVFAESWFNRFLDEKNDDRAWAAFQVFLHFADERCLTWIPTILASYLPSGRERLLEMSRRELSRKLKQHKERKERLFGVKIPSAQIFPFIG